VTRVLAVRLDNAGDVLVTGPASGSTSDAARAPFMLPTATDHPPKTSCASRSISSCVIAPQTMSIDRDGWNAPV